MIYQFISYHRIGLVGNREIKYSNSWIRGDHMDMTKWKPNQICPYGIGFGDMMDGGYFMLPRILLLGLKLKLMGIRKLFHSDK